MSTLLQLLSRVIRLGVFFLPFIASVVFGDRPVREVLVTNRSFTIVVALLLIVSGTLFVTVDTLKAMRSLSDQLEVQVQTLEKEAKVRTEKLHTLENRLQSCMSRDYDPHRVLNRLRD